MGNCEKGSWQQRYIKQTDLRELHNALPASDVLDKRETE